MYSKSDEIFAKIRLIKLKNLKAKIKSKYLES